MPKKIKHEWKDSDADGLLDSEEHSHGTDPLRRDTDHDDLGDYEEVKVYGTDPLNPDTDDDGVSDGAEVKMGRNPRGPGMLHDLFIPHEGNDYKPHALHPRRLAFHALAVISLKGLLVAFLLSFPIQAWLTPDILSAESRKIVDLTNGVRTNLSLNTLSINPILERAALDKAEDMLVDQYFAHISPDNKGLATFLANRGYGYSIAGENLAIGFSTASEVVAAWVKSPTHYANITDEDYTEIGAAMVSGQYSGYDTSLVAQFFGVPKIAAAVPEVPELAPLEPAEPKVTLVSQDVAATVLAEVIQPLGTPKILNIEDELFTKENQIYLEAEAPGAKQLEVMVDGQLELTSPVSELSTAFVLELSEGEHEILLRSTNSGSSQQSSIYKITVDNTAPVIDVDNSSVIANKPLGTDNYLVIKVTASLSEDTETAILRYSDYSIELSRTYQTNEEWRGHIIISGEDARKALSPVILATLVAVDKAGNEAMADINWEIIEPTAVSAVSQYLFLKSSPAEQIKPLFDISGLYYKIILVLASLALLLNIFIKIKRQHPQVIVSSLGFIALLSLLTFF